MAALHTLRTDAPCIHDTIVVKDCSRSIKESRYYSNYVCKDCIAVIEKHVYFAPFIYAYMAYKHNARNKSIVLRRHFLHCTYTDIAKDCGLSPTTVRGICQNGLYRLRNMLQLTPQCAVWISRVEVKDRIHTLEWTPRTKQFLLRNTIVNSYELCRLVSLHPERLARMDGATKAIVAEMHRNYQRYYAKDMYACIE